MSSRTDPRLIGLTPQLRQSERTSDLEAAIARLDRTGWPTSSPITGGPVAPPPTPPPQFNPPFFERRLDTGVAAGQTSFVVDEAPDLSAKVGFVVIDAYTTEAELRRVTNVSGSSLTVSALTYAHSAGDRVLFVDGDHFPVTWWGAKGDAANNDAPAIQAAIDVIDGLGNGRVTVPYSVNSYRCESNITISGATELVGQGRTAPVLNFVNDSGYGTAAVTGSNFESVIRNLNIRGPTGVFTIDPPPITAITGVSVSGTDVTFTAVAHGLAVGDRVLVVDVLMTAGTGVNGAHTITATPTADTFTCTITTTSTTYSSGGLAIDPVVDMAGFSVKGRIYECQAQGFFAGFLTWDHLVVKDCFFGNNFYGQYNHVGAQGDVRIEQTYFGPCRLASVGTSETGEFIGGSYYGCQFGRGPYYFYMEPASNTSAPFLRAVFYGCNLEGATQAFLWADPKDGTTRIGTVESTLFAWCGETSVIGTTEDSFLGRPTTYGWRCLLVNNMTIIEGSGMLTSTSQYDDGLFDVATVSYLRVTGGSSKSFFDNLAQKKICSDTTSVKRFEIEYISSVIRVVKASGTVNILDLVETDAGGGNQKVRQSTGTRPPYGVVFNPTGATPLRVSYTNNELMPVVIESHDCRINTSIGSGSGSHSRLVPDPANAGKVKAGTASSADQIGYGVANSNGTTIQSRINVLPNGGIPTAAQTYTPTNVTTDRAYDANATTVDELADVLGSLIADLQTAGIVL